MILMLTQGSWPASGTAVLRVESLKLMSQMGKDAAETNRMKRRSPHCPRPTSSPSCGWYENWTAVLV